MKKGYFFKMEELSSLEKKMLVERHWISRELSKLMKDLQSQFHQITYVL